MKIDNVDLICSSADNTINMSFRDPGATNPFIAKEILGLDADEIVPRFYGRSTDGDRQYAFSMERREIVIKLQLNPEFTANQTYSDLRDDVYRCVSSSRSGLVRLDFKLGVVNEAYIKGFITKVEAGLFAESQEIQITIRCDDPQIRGAGLGIYDLTDLDSTFPVITDDKSTAPHGFAFDVLFTANSPRFSLTDPIAEDWEFIITPVGGFLTGDILYANTESNDKYLYYVRGSVVTHLIDRIDPGGAWPLIFPGINTFQNEAVVTWEHISFVEAYWGI